MKKNLIEQIEIPEGIEINIDKTSVIVKNGELENKRAFKAAKIKFEKKDNKIILSSENATKREKKILNTTKAHIINMIKGAQEKFEYKLKVCFSHFPMKVEIDEDKSEATIKNFLGEKIPRKVKILEGAGININGGIITITSNNKEIAGQTAANFEKATRITNRDRRVFQDGIFITNKPGREI